MKKLALFVEGQTELIFARRLLEEVGGRHNIQFREERIHAKSTINLTSDNFRGQKYFILIVDCCGDGSVATAIKDRHSGLKSAGYSLILGLRDLFPFTLSDLTKLKSGLASAVPSSTPAVHICVAVAEIEAWFMQENLHFQKIISACTRIAIQNSIGFDIESDLAENLPKPSRTLKQSYMIGRRTYRKSKKHVSRTVNALD